MTSFNILEPVHLTLPAIQSIIDEALNDFSLLMLFDANLERGLLTMGVGAAEGWPPTTEAEFCNVGWDFTYPQVLRESIQYDGHRFENEEAADFIRIVVKNPDEWEPLIVFPLSDFFVQMQMTTDHILVGEPAGSVDDWSYAQDWDNDGLITGWIYVDNAIEVDIPLIGADLCQLLAGEPCEGDPESWDIPPVIGPSGAWAYSFEAEIGAGAVTIR